MIEIKDLLAKFSNVLFSEEIKKEAVRKAIAESINVEIKPQDVEIKNGVIYLNIKPIYKNEVFLKQEEISLKVQEIFNKTERIQIR
jgi:hypothetical protein